MTSADFPTVASNGHGVVVSAWYLFLARGERVVARTSTNGGRTWGPRQSLGPALLSHFGARPALVRAAVSPTGQAAVVWQQATGPHTQRVVLATAMRGARFSRVHTLSGNEGIAAYPDVAFDGTGRAVVVWVTRTQVQRVLIAAGRAGRPRTVATGTVPDEPALAVDARGDRLYGWIENTNSGTAIWSARERASGSLKRPQRLQHQSTTQIPFVDVAIAPSGRATVVYEQDVGISSVIWAVSASWASRFGAGQRLSPFRRTAILGGSASGSRGVGVDGSGRVSAIWMDDPPGPPGRFPSPSHVRVATSNAVGRFGSPRTLQTTSAAHVYERGAIAVAPGGGLIAAWSEQPSGVKGQAFVWGSAARGPGGPFSRPFKLSGPDGDRAAAAATSIGGAGVAVWAEGTEAGTVRAARWTP